MLPARLVPSRGTTRARAAAALVSAAVLGTALLVGCGPFGAAMSEPSAAPLPAAPVTVGPDVVVPESDGGGAPAPSPSPDASPAAGETSCTEVQAAWNETNQALVNLSADHPRALVNSFRVAGEAMGKVEAPEAIAKPWATMSDYLKRVNAALENVDADDAAGVSGAMADTVSAADTQAATAAGEKVTAFVAAGCKS
ncbi:hypothetical protein [Xylanimonas sp. McL0601]|uniref:hypothetical protein n=1 Tax=Xylanimonas sp. McL0601 TaxID=3414739 RepID=UPI003CF31C83